MALVFDCGVGNGGYPGLTTTFVKALVGVILVAHC